MVLKDSFLQWNFHFFHKTLAIFIWYFIFEIGHFNWLWKLHGHLLKWLADLTGTEVSGKNLLPTQYFRTYHMSTIFPKLSMVAYLKQCCSVLLEGDLLLLNKMILLVCINLLIVFSLTKLKRSQHEKPSPMDWNLSMVTTSQHEKYHY